MSTQWNEAINDRPTPEELDKMERNFMRSERMRLFWKFVGYGFIIIVVFVALSILGA